jgi:hypothetical protein
VFPFRRGEQLASGLLFSRASLARWLPPHVLIPPLSRDEQTSFDLNAIAKEAVSALDDRREMLRSRVGPPSQPWLMLAPCQHCLALRSRRGAKNLPAGQMWTAHGVQVPIWGYCTDRTTRELQTAPVREGARRFAH